MSRNTSGQVTIPKPNVVLRVAQPAEDWAVHRLFGALHAFNAGLDARFALAEAWPQVLDEYLAHVRAAGHGLVLLAWEGDVPLGLLIMDGHSDSPLFRYRHWAELLALHVVPEARGCGIAERLLKVGAAWASARGYERIQLYVTASNARAKRLYERTGFRPVQEIWRLELGPATRTPPDDPDCAALYAHGHNLLEISPHHLAIEDDLEAA
jgi:ribosomal protein S18 acetylase RimI-like enzyme